MKVAINGFGRIGRNFLRCAKGTNVVEDLRRAVIGIDITDKESIASTWGDIISAMSGLDIVAINDLGDVRANANLLRYDTVHGRYPGTVEVVDGDMVVDGATFKVFAERDPSQLPWGELGVDVVIESTGVFATHEAASKHLEAGAKFVIVSAPMGDPDISIVLGVNDDELDPSTHKIISNASCTTNCLAPVAKVLHENFGIVKGFITTVHAYTNDQRLADVPHTDWRRSRAAAENIIPTSTGAARAVGEVLPELAGRLDGIASRVPVADGSVVDLFVELESSVSASDVHAAVRSASMGPMMDVLEYADGPIVSSDVIGNPHSSIYDSQFTIVSGGRFVKTLNWYDNEWGYSCKVVEMARVISD